MGSGRGGRWSPGPLTAWVRLKCRCFLDVLWLHCGLCCTRKLTIRNDIKLDHVKCKYWVILGITDLQHSRISTRMRPACGPCASQFLFLSFMEGLEARSFADDKIFQRYKRPRFNWKEAKKDAQLEICSLKLDNFWILDTAGNYMTTGWSSHRSTVRQDGCDWWRWGRWLKKIIDITC